MSEFLNQWDKAIAEAQSTNKPATIVKQDHMLNKPQIVARTMHPSFMGVRPAKYDPQRDSN